MKKRNAPSAKAVVTWAVVIVVAVAVAVVIASLFAAWKVVNEAVAA